MNTFTDILFIYVYIVSLIILGFINLDSDNYLLNKLYLFVYVLIFSGVLGTLKNFKSTCKKTGKEVFTDSITTAIRSVIGMMIYTDLIHMQWSNKIFTGINNSKFNRSLIVPFIIVVTQFLIQSIYTPFELSIDNCT